MTLVEVLVASGLLAVLALVLATVSIGMVSRSSDSSMGRHLDGAVAQVASTAFGRDVQGADRLGDDGCGAVAGATGLVDLVASHDGSVTTYWRSSTADGVHTLVRTACDGSGAVVASREVAEGLALAPWVSCSPAPCEPGDRPDRVTLHLARTTSFAFDVSGDRRTTTGPGGPAPLLPAQLFSLGGTSPLRITGNGRVEVQGNAFVNATSPDAVRLDGGNARLVVSGDLRIQAGGGCSGCTAVKVSPFPPGSYPVALPDPLAHLPVPAEADLPTASCPGGTCTYQGPGTYPKRLALTAPTTLAPGTYVLRAGLSVSGRATVTGHGVLLVNGCGAGAPSGCAAGNGALSVSGQASLDLSPPTSGTYAGVLLVQPRENTRAISVSGTGGVQSLTGTIYAPGSTGVTLGTGGGTMRIGAVVGTNLTVTGNGTVVVGGS